MSKEKLKRDIIDELYLQKLELTDANKEELGKHNQDMEDLEYKIEMFESIFVDWE